MIRGLINREGDEMKDYICVRHGNIKGKRGSVFRQTGNEIEIKIAGEEFPRKYCLLCFRDLIERECERID